VAKPDLTPEVLAVAREDLFTFMALVHTQDNPMLYDGQAVPFQHHRRMIDALMREDHTVIVTPRGSGKTTLVQGFEEWTLGRASMGDKDWANRHRVLYVSSAATQAYKVSNAIRATIEANKAYHAIFPKVKPHPQKWGQEEWKVKGNTIKDSNFLAMGMDGPALGSRAEIIYLDDIGNEKNMGTPYMREGVRETLENTILPIMVPWGRFVMTATRWAWDDPVAWAIDRRGWQPIVMKAIETDEDGEESSYWPERFSLEHLRTERLKAPTAFARQYQNEVVPDEGLIFEREWFERRFDYLPNEMRFVVNSWDTAAGEGRNRSYSAGWAALVTLDFHVYLFKLQRGQVPYPYLKEGIRHLADDTNAGYVIIEKKSSGHSAIQEFALEPRPWQLIEWHPFGQRGSPKRREANERISDMCMQGRVHLPSEYFVRKTGANWLYDAEKELFSYPEGETDDIVDALCQMLYWIEDQHVRTQRYLTEGTGPAWGSSWGRKAKV